MSMPNVGTPEYLQLLEETGGASSLPGFNYEAHLAATSNIPAEEVQEEPKPVRNFSESATSDTSSDEAANTLGLISNQEESRLLAQEKDSAPSIDNNTDSSPENSPDVVVDKTKQLMPSEGTAEYEKLLEETGGASGLPGFNYQAHLAATKGTPKTQQQSLDVPVDDISSTMPLIGTAEYEKLLEETGGASGLPGFNYQAHLAATSSSNADVDSDKEILLITPPQKIQSIDEITTQNQVTTFQLIKSVRLQNQQVEMLITGTDKKDKITGSSEGEILSGGKGKDVLKGGDGADGFLFQNPDFGKKGADNIKDFNYEEGDSIIIDKEIFKVGKKVSLKSVAGKKALKKASKTNNPFVYDEKKGFLYFNENGKEKGWGDGGLFVKLQGAPELAQSDFSIV